MRHAAVAGPACNDNGPAGPSSINRERERAGVCNCDEQWAVGARVQARSRSESHPPGHVGGSPGPPGSAARRPLFLLLSSPARGERGGEQVAGEPLGGTAVRRVRRQRERERERERSAGEKGARDPIMPRCAVQRRGGVGD